jgi:hypothetical protein
MTKNCARCAGLQQTASRHTTTFTYSGWTHTHPECPIIRKAQGR